MIQHDYGMLGLIRFVLLHSWFLIYALEIIMILLPKCLFIIEHDWLMVYHMIFHIIYEWTWRMQLGILVHEEWWVLLSHEFCFFCGFLYDWLNKIGSFYAIWINSIYEFWHWSRKPWVKKRKGKLNWARGLGGFLYISSLWCTFFCLESCRLFKLQVSKK